MTSSVRLPTLRENLRALPTPAWILFAGTFVNRFGTFVMPFLVIYVTRLGYSAAQAGLAVSAYGAGHLAASMLGGHLADRIGRRHTIALSMFSSAAAMIALYQAKTFLLIVILSALAGTAAELYRPASFALIGDLVAPEQRITAFAMYRLAINLGFAAGPATAGLLADRSFAWLFYGDAITSALYGIIALAALPHGLRRSAGHEPRGEFLRVALRDRPFMLFLMATLCVTWIEFQVHSTLPLYVQSLGFSAATYGLLISLNGVLIVLFELAITSWTQRFRPQVMIFAGYALSSIGYALTGLAHTVPALAMTVVLWTIGEMIFAPVGGAYITNLAPEHLRGRYHGLTVQMWSIGMVIGPTAGTWVFQRAPAMLWIACGVIGGLGSMLVLIRPADRANKPGPLARETPGL